MAIYSNYPQNDFSNQGDIVASNDGHRSPSTKTHDGKAVAYHCLDAQGTNYGGNWLVWGLISDVNDYTLFTTPGLGTPSAPIEIDGITYYVSDAGANREYGRATMYTDDCVVMSVGQLMYPNQSLSGALEQFRENWLKLFSRLGISQTPETTGATTSVDVVFRSGWPIPGVGLADTSAIDLTPNLDGYLDESPTAVQWIPASSVASAGTEYKCIINASGARISDNGIIRVYDRTGGPRQTAVRTREWNKLSDDTLQIVINFGPTGKSSPYGGSTSYGGRGGDGTHDNGSDKVDKPDLPNLTVADTGLIAMYNPSRANLIGFANFLWSDTFSIDSFKKLFADPMQAVLGLQIFPCAPDTGGAKSILIGNVDTEVSAPVISSQYKKFNCGSITIDEYWGSYLDYSPYTQIQIYLPYIGVRQLDPDDIMGATVNVEYHVDFLSGACIAFISAHNAVLYSFAGQCSAEVPLTGSDMSGIVSSVMQITTMALGVGSAAVSAGASTPAAFAALGAGAAGGAAQAAASGGLKQVISRSGSVSGAAGLMGVQYPYLIITRPVDSIAEDQGELQGYASNVTGQLGSFAGYTQCQQVELYGDCGTESEQQEIKRYLTSGVIL